jgi:hypothetical protein
MALTPCFSLAAFSRLLVPPVPRVFAVIFGMRLSRLHNPSPGPSPGPGEGF